MSLTANELELIVERLLAEGIPPGAVSRVFGLDLVLVKKAQKKVRVERYGTDDMAEYMEQMQWDAIDKAREIIARGSATEQSRYVAAVLGKQMAVAARRTPESQRQMQDKVMDLLETMKRGESGPTEQSRFVAIPGGLDDDAGA